MTSGDRSPDHYELENARAAELVSRVAQGERVAEESLVRLFDRRLLVKLRQHQPNPETIADLRQEVWLRALSVLRRGGVEQPERFFGFLLGMARNVIREHAKATHRHEATPTDLETVPDPGPDIEYLLDRDRLAQRLRESLALLLERDREILIRHYLRGEDKAQTTRLLGLTPLSYNNVLHRARRRLASLLKAGGAR